MSNYPCTGCSWGRGCGQGVSKNAEGQYEDATLSGNPTNDPATSPSD